jgi:hypothetical protein
MHLGATVQHLGYIKSDHRPILIDTDYHAGAAQCRSGPRRFESKWLREKKTSVMWYNRHGMQHHMRY